MCDSTDADLPCVWTLLGATMALMTAHAAPVADARVDAETQQRLMARKIASNLFFLQHHPQAPADLRMVLGNLQTRWLAPPPGLPATGRMPLH